MRSKDFEIADLQKKLHNLKIQKDKQVYTKAPRISAYGEGAELRPKGVSAFHGLLAIDPNSENSRPW